VELPLNSHYLPLEMLLGLLVTGLLAGLLRWTYGTPHQHVAPPAEDGDDTDLGLLREVAVVPGPEVAEVIRVLAVDGIRATARPSADATGHRILVFAKDEPTAKLVLSRPD
jgi:hypothetical protein